LRTPTLKIAFFLALTFGIAWTVWVTGIRLKIQPDLLFVGTAAPGLAGLLLGRRPNGFRFPWILFVIFMPVCWSCLVLANGMESKFRSLDWNPLLLLPAVVSAAMGSFLVSTRRDGSPGARWALIALFSMPAIFVVPAWIASAIGLPVVHPRHAEPLAMTLASIGVLGIKQFLFAGILEEPGWRGYLLPRLQERYSPLIASLLVWFPWALWHAPFDFTGGVGKTWLSYLQARVIYFIAITILLTWFYNRSGESILVVALFHAAFNTFPFVLPYSPPFLALIFVWVAWAVFDGKMWRRVPPA
jgi:membrane protease YdiL (CAAX protease family)